VLSEIGRFLTPAFTAMGIEQDNWPSTVGIFTGLFAKEVVVGTLDTLYTSGNTKPVDFNLLNSLEDAVASISKT